MDPTPTARSADLLLFSRAARLDRWSVPPIANVDDAPRDAFSFESGKTCESRQKRSLRIHRVFRCRLAPPTARPRTSEVGSAGPVEADLPSDMQGRDVKRLDIIYILKQRWNDSGSL